MLPLLQALAEILASEISQIALFPMFVKRWVGQFAVFTLVGNMS